MRVGMKVLPGGRPSTMGEQIPPLEEIVQDEPEGQTNWVVLPRVLVARSRAKRGTKAVAEEANGVIVVIYHFELKIFRQKDKNLGRLLLKMIGKIFYIFSKQKKKILIPSDVSVRGPFYSPTYFEGVPYLKEVPGSMYSLHRSTWYVPYGTYSK